MKVLVSGASGLIGTALCERLRAAGHTVGRLVRSAPDPNPEAREIYWKPSAEEIDQAPMEGYAGVVHLAGVNIAGGRWNDARKEEIRLSRVQGTGLLAHTLAHLHTAPRVLVCASGVNVYGSKGDEILTETTPAGEGFLPDVCREWEAAADPAREKGIRTVHLRFGMVLSPHGGALAKMLPPFKLGVAGKIGSGRQYMPWIALDDAVRVIEFALTTEGMAGPVNAVAPDPVTNEEFTLALGHALGRPTFATLPAFAARLVFGEMADALLLSSCRAVPRRLLEAGFTFDYPEIGKAFDHLLKEGN